jgi:hypothetical protein
MDVGSKSKYPANKLSNFAGHAFVLDGVRCASMEGFLQGLKFKNPEMQKHVCGLVGLAAKRAGSKKNWQRTQTLWWRGKPYRREGAEYYELLSRAYLAMLRQSDGFRRALLASGDAILRHSIGKSDPKKTVLTEREFCRFLTHMRAIAKMEDRDNARH